MTEEERRLIHEIAVRISADPELFALYLRLNIEWLANDCRGENPIVALNRLLEMREQN